MADLNLENLKPGVAKKIEPFFNEILDKYSENIHSINVTGTAITEEKLGKIVDKINE